MTYPIYDCGAPDCIACQTAFGPDRTAAIAAYERRCAPVYLRPALSPTAALQLLVRDIDSLGTPPAQLLVALALARETLAAETCT